MRLDLGAPGAKQELIERTHLEMSTQVVDRDLAGRDLGLEFLHESPVAAAQISDLGFLLCSELPLRVEIAADPVEALSHVFDLLEEFDPLRHQRLGRE